MTVALGPWSNVVMGFLRLLAVPVLLLLACASAQGASPTGPKAMLQRAKDAVTTAMASARMGSKAKYFYLEEVVPYATYFVDESGAALPSRIQDYIRFSADGLSVVNEDRKKSVPLCYEIHAEEGCVSCAEARDEIVKYLPKRLSRRGFDVRALTAPAAAAEEPGHGAADASGQETFEAYMALAQEGGCPHALWGSISLGDRGAMRGVFYADVRDAGKRRYRVGYQAVVRPETKEEAVFTPGVIFLARATEAIYSDLGAQRRAVSNPGEVEGPLRLVRLENVMNYGDYSLFKKKLVDGLEGLEDLAERTMAPGVVEFAVVGDITMAQLNARLVNTVGAEPVIDSVKLEGENVLRVVLK